MPADVADETVAPVRVIERNPEAGLSTEMQPKAFEQEAQQAGESVQ